MTLKELYTQNLPEYEKAITDYLKGNMKKIANPLLISDKKLSKFSEGDIRVMFFGQETNSWENGKPLEIDLLQKIYDDFYTSDYCYSYGGQFWNGINRLKELMEKEFPNKKIEFIWNNIIKVGKEGKGRPKDKILEIEKNYFNVIQNELEILNPNVIIFFTGPNYDDVLKKTFIKIEQTEIPNFKNRQLIKMKIPHNCISYRTYHPNFLWRNDINKYLNSIIEDIKKSLH